MDGERRTPLIFSLVGGDAARTGFRCVLFFCFISIVVMCYITICSVLGGGNNDMKLVVLDPDTLRVVNHYTRAC